jgi:hypothetical protein
LTLNSDLAIQNQTAPVGGRLQCLSSSGEHHGRLIQYRCEN